MRGFLVYFLALVVLVSLSEGLECYTCVSNMNDLTCVNNPSDVVNGSPITNCKQGDNMCCTILRQEYLEEKGKVISFSRSCQKDCPKNGFHKLPDSTFMIYQTYCDTPKCNKGPGNKPLNDGGGGGDDDGHVIHNIPGNSCPASATINSGLLLTAAAHAIFPRN
ncbi:uncharacterized protein LOC121879076 isoform X1 [Homarus americanus]|nr:uncharacterized protein LOC121879076 isoform X1 [Homarus americanus]